MPVKKYDKPNKTIQCIRMLKILKAKQFLKKAEIAYLLGEETDRNINNYKNTLYDAGYPIYYKPGRYGGYYLEQDGMLPGNRLNDVELQSLGVAYEYLMKESRVPNKKLLLDYIGNAFIENKKAFSNTQLSLFGHFPLSMPIEEIEKRYYMIQTAIDAKKKIKILYRGYNRDSYKVICPYKLFKYTNWIVFAYDETIQRQTYSPYNNFKLHRMLEIEWLDEPFTVDEDFEEEAYFDESGTKEPLIHVKCKFYGKIGRMLDEKIYGQNQQVTCLNKRYHIYQFEADMRNTMVIKKFILSFGSRCEVIEPSWIRDDMIEDAQKLLKRYEKQEKNKKKQ